MAFISAENRRYINLEADDTVSITREPSPEAKATIGPEDGRLIDDDMKESLSRLAPPDGDPQKFRDAFQKDVRGVLEGI